MRALLALPLLAATACTGPTAEKPCLFTASSWNMDDQNPVIPLTVANTGATCSLTVSMDRRPVERGGEIVEPPAHGRARIRRLPTATLAQYTPDPGYTGPDRFQARLGPGSQTITVNVTVRPKPTT